MEDNHSNFSCRIILSVWSEAVKRLSWKISVKHKLRHSKCCLIVLLIKPLFFCGQIILSSVWVWLSYCKDIVAQHADLLRLQHEHETYLQNYYCGYNHMPRMKIHIFNRLIIDIEVKQDIAVLIIHHLPQNLFGSCHLKDMISSGNVDTINSLLVLNFQIPFAVDTPFPFPVWSDARHGEVLIH